MFQKVVNIQGSNVVIGSKVRDNNSKETEASIAVGIDYTKPTISITSPADNSTTQTIVNRTASDSGISLVQIKVNNQNYKGTIGKDTWDKQVSLTNGTNTIFAKSVDNASGFNETNITVIVQGSGGSSGSGSSFSGGMGSRISFLGDSSEDPRDWKVYFVMTDRFVDGFSGNNNFHRDEY